MKLRPIAITAVIFFIVVNTTYFWEGLLGGYAMATNLILGTVFIFLGFYLIRQLYLFIREKFANKKRLIGIAILAIVLILTAIKPRGIIDFDQLRGGNLLIASRKGVAGCTINLKLKDNNRFILKYYCFGVTQITGNYYLKNDTIFFKDVDMGRHEGKSFHFAVVKPNTSENIPAEMDIFDVNNSFEEMLWITKNNLKLVAHQ